MDKQLRQLVDTAYRKARRIIVLVIGGTGVLAGVAMLVLPGPGIVAILVGLGVLAVEFEWARRWLKRIKASATDIKDRVTHAAGTSSSTGETTHKGR